MLIRDCTAKVGVCRWDDNRTCIACGYQYPSLEDLAERVAKLESKHVSQWLGEWMGERYAAFIAERNALRAELTALKSECAAMRGVVAAVQLVRETDPSSMWSGLADALDALVPRSHE